MNGIHIRPMQQADIALLCAAEGGETPDNRECFERYLQWQQEQKDCAFLLAFLNGQLAGHLFVFYHDCPAGTEGVDMPRLADIHVYESFRRRGIAKALMNEGERLAQAISDHAFLTVSPEEEPFLQRMYTDRGYHPDGVEGDQLVMVKRFSGK